MQRPKNLKKKKQSEKSENSENLGILINKYMTQKKKHNYRKRRKSENYKKNLTKSKHIWNVQT